MEITTTPLVNKVEESGLITLNLEEYFPKEPIKVFDLKDYLFRELILKEKEFRAALKAKDWSEYKGANVAITCSADAIIPFWAHMLVASALAPVAQSFYMGNTEAFLIHHYYQTLAKIDWKVYAGQRVVIKGCGDFPVPVAAYAEVTRLLQPHVKSIMYGEPCSTVPVFKQSTPV